MHCVNSSGFHSGRRNVSSESCDSHEYERMIPARIPCGGSFVSLIDACSRPMGNLGLGSDVIQMRAS